MSSSICCKPAINPNYIPINCKGFCNISSSLSSSAIYQRQKIIQNTVRVHSSLYTMNIGGLNVYELPDSTYGVNWKQMSDRRIPHVQKNIVPSGRSTKHSYTWHRPCCQSPGGSGVDMKHGSYDRYLAKLKGKGPLRRGVISQIEPEIKFNRAFPIYGGKTFKTSIVNGYNCPICHENNADNIIYNSFQKNVFYNDIYKFNQGDFVLTYDDIHNKLVRAFVVEVLANNNYLIQLETTQVRRIVNVDSLFIQPNITGCAEPICGSSNVIVPDVQNITIDPSILFERIIM